MSRPAWTREFAWTAAVAALATSVAAWVLDLPAAALSRPWTYIWDGLQVQAIFKEILQTGFYAHDPALGFPFGQDSLDFPILSNLSPDLWLVKALGVVSHDPFTVVNAFYLLSFPLAGAAAYLCLRALDIARAPAAVCALLFAVAPYHFQKGEQQLLQSSIYTVPLLCLVALRAAQGTALWARRAPASGRRGTAWATRRSLLTLAMCVVIGLGSVYYAVFAVLLVAAGALLGAAGPGGRRALTGGLVAAAAVVVALGASQVQTVLYRHAHGTNAQTANRPWGDSETFGLKLDQLVLPVPGHRVGALSRLGTRFNTETTVPSERTGNLGLVGTAGLVWLLGLGIAAAVGGRVRGSPLERSAAALTLVAILIASVGGVSALIALGISPQIRSWGRMAIVIEFLALIGIAGLLGRVRARRGQRAALIAVVVVAVVGVLDQTTSRFRPDYAALDAAYAQDAGLAHGLERTLGRGAVLLQLPYSPYPEGPTWAGGDYEHLRPYLHSSLRTSYGATKGRASDWLATMEEAPLAALVDGAAASGFAAVWVDGAAYGDGGAALKAALAGRLGAPIAGTDRYAIYDLRPRAARLRAQVGAGGVATMRAATVTPVRTDWTAGFSGKEGGGEGFTRTTGAHGVLALTNPGDTPRSVIVSATVSTATTVTLPGDTTRPVAAGGRLAARVTLPPGRSDVRFATAAPPLHVSDAVVLDASLCPGGRFGCTAGPRPQLR